MMYVDGDKVMLVRAGELPVMHGYFLGGWYLGDVGELTAGERLQLRALVLARKTALAT
jgi:hypothetical protein